MIEEANAADGQEVEQQEVQEVQSEEVIQPDQQEESSDVGRVVQAVRQDYQGKLDEEKRARQMVELELLQLRQSQQAQQKPVEDEDGDDLMTKAEFRQALNANVAQVQRQTAEQTWMASNQDKVTEIETYLPDILKQKPWLADVIEKAPNRYEIAADLVSSYKPREQASVAKRMVENAAKPGNPAAVGKSGTLSNLDKLKSMTPKEFKEYRRQLLNRR